MGQLLCPLGTSDHSKFLFIFEETPGPLHHSSPFPRATGLTLYPSRLPAPTLQEFLLYVQPKCLMLRCKPSLSTSSLFRPPHPTPQQGAGSVDMEGALTTGHNISEDEGRPSNLRGNGTATPGLSQKRGGCSSPSRSFSGCGSFIYSLLLFILCLVFAEGCSRRTHSLAPPCPGSRGLPGGGRSGPVLESLSEPTCPLGQAPCPLSQGQDLIGP